LIWEQVTAQIRFHSQKLNIPIETIQLSDDSYQSSDYEGLQVLFKINTDEPVILNESSLQVGYPLKEDNLKAVTKALMIISRL